MDLNLLEGQGRSLPRPATIGPVRKRGQLACQVGQRPVTIPPVQTTEPQASGVIMTSAVDCESFPKPATIGPVRKRGQLACQVGKRPVEVKALLGDESMRDFDSEKKPKKHEKAKKIFTNVLQRMEDATEGPMSVLHRAVKEKRRVKVWIRSHRCMRGICKGYLLAFDKHYNLAMADVDEVYQHPFTTLGIPEHKKTSKATKENRPYVDSFMQINDAQPTVVPGVTADAPELATTDAQELSTTDAPELATTDDAPDITSDIEQIPESVVKTEPITSESTIDCEKEAIREEIDKLKTETGLQDQDQEQLPSDPENTALRQEIERLQSEAELLNAQLHDLELMEDDEDSSDDEHSPPHTRVVEQDVSDIKDENPSNSNVDLRQILERKKKLRTENSNENSKTARMENSKEVDSKVKVENSKKNESHSEKLCGRITRSTSRELLNENKHVYRERDRKEVKSKNDRSESSTLEHDDSRRKTRSSPRGHGGERPTSRSVRHEDDRREYRSSTREHRRDSRSGRRDERSSKSHHRDNQRSPTDRQRSSRLKEERDRGKCETSRKSDRSQRDQYDSKSRRDSHEYRKPRTSERKDSNRENKYRTKSIDNDRDSLKQKKQEIESKERSQKCVNDSKRKEVNAYKTTDDGDFLADVCDDDILERHVNQLFIRGDNVVLVCFAD